MVDLISHDLGERLQADDARRKISYTPLPTLKQFHECDAVNRCVIGPFGSGKTSAAIMEIGYYLPYYIYNIYGVKNTRWTIVRNTFGDLYDNVQRPMMEDWLPFGKYNSQRHEYTIRYPDGIKVEFWFRGCDILEHVRKFRGLLTTGVWVDESDVVAQEIKDILKGRIGRYPKDLIEVGQKYGVQTKWFIETSNPMDVEHPMFSMYKWVLPPPDVVPSKKPLKGHIGFWQPPYENQANLPVGYYEDMKNTYRDAPEFLDMYVLGKPGTMIKGKLVYYDFTREKHVANRPLTWHKGELYRGWDNTGNHPACVVIQMVGPEKVQVLKEYCSDRMGILDFAQWVVVDCNQRFPGAEYTDYADPAGESKMSSAAGGLTSNGDIMREFGINVIPSEQNWEARRESVQRLIGKTDGLLVDSSCTRLINGFIAGYCYPQIGTTGVYKDKPMKNKFSDVHDATQYCFCKIFRSVTGRASMAKMAAMQRAHLQKMDRANV